MTETAINDKHEHSFCGECGWCNTCVDRKDDEIELLREALRTLGVYTFSDDSLGPFIAAEKDCGLSVGQDVADAVKRAENGSDRA